MHVFVAAANPTIMPRITQLLSAQAVFEEQLTWAKHHNDVDAIIVLSRAIDSIKADLNFMRITQSISFS